MSQQINLFNPLFLEQKKYFSAAAMLQALALLVAGVAVFYGYALYQRGDLQRQAAVTDRAYAVSRERFAKLSAELSSDRSEQQLDQELKAAQDAVAAREAMLGGVSDPNAGYSGFLRAFARQALPGVWLTGIRIDAGAQQLTLTGRTLQPELLPEYIRRLGDEERLKGRSFDRIQATRHDAAPNAAGQRGIGFIEFTLVSPAKTAASLAAMDRKSGQGKAN